MWREWLAALTAATTTLLILWLIHGPIVVSPNQYLFGSRGEAIRNYFVLSYHAQPGGSLHEFGGMNYPFGEQIVYSEGQPSLSYPLRLLSVLDPWFQGHAAGVLNLFLLAGVVGSAVLLFLILRRFRVGILLSVTSAVGLALLAPQGSRLPWMFPQAFSALLPVGIYLVIRIVDGGWAWWRISHLMVANVFFLFLNPYPGMISASFTTLALAGVLFLRVGPRPGLVDGGLKILTSTVVPVLVFYAYLRTTDHHCCRPELPGGFFDFTAEFSTVFGSFYSPLMPAVERWTGLSRTTAWRHFEGNGYLGFFCLTVLLIVSGWLLWVKAVRRTTDVNGLDRQDSRLIAALAIASVCLGMFAAGLPFRLLDDGERWLSMLGPLAQFRCPGRFIWPLFYVANIVAVVAAARLVSRLFSPGRWRMVASVVVVLGSGVMVFEGVAQHRWVAARGRGTVNILNRQLVETRPSLAYLKNAVDAVDRTKYQAVLTIPLFHIGSELLIPPSSFSERFLSDAFAFSNSLHLPLISSMLGRISLDESLATLSLYTPPFVAKGVCSQFDSRPVLVIVNRDRPLDEDEERLASLAQPKYSSDRFDVLELDAGQLCRFDQEGIFDDVVGRLPSFQRHGSVLTDQPAAVFLDTFDRYEFRRSMRGEGALSISGGETGWIFDSAAVDKQLEIGRGYELTFWFFNRGGRLRAEVLVESNRPGGLPEIHNLPELKRSFYSQGDWSLFSFPITLVHPGQRIRVGLRSEKSAGDLVVDELLLRANDATAVWRIDQGQGHISHLVWNNHDLERP